MESRTQGTRPRTQKNPRPRPRTALPRTDPCEAKDRNARDQDRGPRTQTPEVESRTQGSRPRPRTQTKNSRPRPRTAFPRTDTLEAKDRNARGQGPRTQAQVLSKKKKKCLHKNFSSDLHKKTFSKKIFQALHKILTLQKILLSSSWGQANFRGLEASRPRTWPSRPRPRTSKCVLEDVLEAKDVLENSTSDKRKCSPKKSLQKFFLAISKKHGPNTFFSRSTKF